jgi:NADH-quinone oxidoreductase subunit M
MLIPMYFLIGVWGGPRRIYATLKFVLMTMFGSLLMLVAIFALYSFYYKATGTYSLEIFDFYKLILNPQVQGWLFLGFALAFAIKVPMFPFHTWLPDAHVEAPTAASVILAAVLLKMGTYGFLRFALPLFPDALERFLPLLSILALIGIIYGGLMALIQKDIKSLVAYSSVSHMGLIMLAVFSLNTEGVEGAIYQMLNHGLSTGALFLIVGILYERAHTRLIKDFGGVSSQMPVFSAFFLVCLLSAVGLPGLNGFVGEILCLFGIFKTSQLQAILAVSTVILAAAYLLWMYQRVMHGPITNEKIRSFKDINKRELGYLVPIIIMMFWMGIYPQPFLRKMDASVSRLLDRVHNRERIFLRETSQTTSLKSDRAAEAEVDQTAKKILAELEEKR